MILLSVLWSFLKVGALSFGGGYAMIPMIEREIILLHRWVTMDQFIDMISVSWVTPGPIAVNSATFVGYRVGGVPGASLATAGVVLPSLILMTVFATMMRKFRKLPSVETVFVTLRPVVASLVAVAGLSVARSSVVDPTTAVIGGLVLVAMLRTRLSPFLLIGITAAGGVILHLVTGFR